MTRTEMTAHYARLSRHRPSAEHWEQGPQGQRHRARPSRSTPTGRSAEAAWAKHQLGRATQALPNGYCGLPVVKTCPHANACLTCPMFVTTPEFLPQHRAPAAATLQIITAAEARGQTRVAEMNKQVAANLDKIITALEDDARQPPGRPPMRPDNTAASLAAARQPARADPRQGHPGAPRTRPRRLTRYLRRRRRRSRHLPVLALYPARHPRPDPATPRLPQSWPGQPIPASQRATDTSLRARLATSLQRNQQLAEENARLRRQLARALGDHRSTRPRSGNNPAP